MTNNIKYELKVQPDSTKIWVEKIKQRRKVYD